MKCNCCNQTIITPIFTVQTQQLSLLDNQPTVKVCANCFAKFYCDKKNKK